MNVFAQGHKYTLNIPDYYSVGATCSIDIWMPNDSAVGKHPVIVGGSGSGEQNSTNNAAGGIGNLVATSNATLRTNNAAKGGTSTFIVATIHVLSGNMDMRYYKNAYRYMTTVKGSMVDVTQINIQGLSLSGGAVNDLIDQNNSDSSTLWASRIASFSTGSAVSGLVNTNPRVLANINTNNVHLRIYYCDDDGNSFSQSQNLNIASLSRGFSPGNTYAHKPDLMFIMTGGHFGGYNAMLDTVHTTWLADSSVEHGGNSAWLNKTYIHNPNTFEWMLQFQTSAIVPNQPPVSNAGSPQTITLPKDSVLLDGSASYDPDGRPLTAYAWTRTSGPNTPTIVTPSASTTRVRGLIQGTYVFSLQVTDDSSATNSNTVTITVNAPRLDTVLQPKEIISLDQYAGTDYNTPENYFDAYGAADPSVGAFGSMSDPWYKTKGAPLKDLGGYFPDSLGSLNGVKYKGAILNRVIVDLVGYADWNNLTAKAVLRKVWALSGQDTLKLAIWNVDKYYFSKSIDDRPIVINRLDSGWNKYGEFRLAGDNHTWQSISGNDTGRYWMITVDKNSAHAIANAYELVFEGHMLAPIDTSLLRKDPDSTTLVNVDRTWHQIIGTNNFKLIDTLDFRHDGVVRTFIDNGNMDTTHAAGIPIHYKDAFPTFPGGGYSWLAALKRAGTRFSSTQQGGSPYSQTHSSARGAGYQFTMTGDTTLQPYDPRFWERSGDLAYQLGLLYGSGSTGDANSKWGAATLHRNLGGDAGIPMGNENLVHCCTIPALAVKKSVEKDGWEGRVGASGKTGFYNADPNFKLNMDADIHANIFNAIALNWLWATQRTDAAPPINIYEVHEYFSIKDSLPSITLSLEEQVGNRGEVPGLAYSKNGLNFYSYMYRFSKKFYRYYPYTVKIALTEQGMGNYGTPASNTTQTASVWDNYTSHNVMSANIHWDSTRMKAAAMNQYQIMAPFVPGLDIYNEYTMENQAPGIGKNDSLDYPLQFQSYGRARKSAITPPFSLQVVLPVYWVRGCTDSVIGNKKADRSGIFITDTNSVWKFRYKNTVNIDSATYAAFRPRFDGDSSSTFVALPGFANGSTINVYRQSFTTDSPIKTPMTVSSGGVTVNISALPMFFEGFIGATPPIPANGQTIHYKKRVIRL